MKKPKVKWRTQRNFKIEEKRELEKQVRIYQETKDESAAKFIIKWFNPMIHMHCNVIFNGLMDVRETNVHNTGLTISLLTNNGMLKNYYGGYKARKGSKTYDHRVAAAVAYENSKILSTIYRANSEPNELYNAAICALLEMASKFTFIESEETELLLFQRYVYKNFSDYFKKYMKPIRRLPLRDIPIGDSRLVNVTPDPLAENPFDHVEDKASERARRDKAKDRFKYFFETTPPDEDTEEFFDLNWFSGYTCHDVLKKLSPLQRKCLYYNYYKNYSHDKIGKLMGINRKTIEYYIRDALEIVSEEKRRLDGSSRY